MSVLFNVWIFVRFILTWVWTLTVASSTVLLWPLVGGNRAWTITNRPWARTTLWSIGVKLQIEGAENLQGPAIFISNHQSLIDVVFLPSILPRTVRFVAKRELLLVPIWGWAFASGGALFINRGKPRQAIQNLRKGLKKLPEGWSLTVFPEGTRSKDGVMQRFKKGAFHMAVETGLPIVPIGMDGAREIVPPDGWVVRGGIVRVTVGKPIDTSHWTNATIDAHVAEGRAAVQACIDSSIARRPNAPSAAAADAEVSVRPPLRWRSN